MGTSKSKRRVKIVESIASAISSKKIFDTIDYRNRNEDYIKQYMHQPLISELELLYENLELSKSMDKDLVKQKAKNCLLWEGDVNTTVNNFTFFGTQHRPDFVVKIDKLSVAVEVKKGETGSSSPGGGVVVPSNVVTFKFTPPATPSPPALRRPYEDFKKALRAL